MFKWQVYLLLSIGLLCQFSCNSIDDEPAASFALENYFFDSEISFDIGGDDSDFVFPDTNVERFVIEESGNEIEDSINHRKWRYNAIFPPSYNNSKERVYPVLYILHGLGSHPDNATLGLRLISLLDYCYIKELLPELIVILPDCEKSYWVDDYIEGVKYETFFSEIFLPSVESKYRIDTSIKRYIFGISMGGYGAAHYAFSYPEMFEYCYSASGVLGGKGVDSTPSIVDTAKSKNGRTLPYLTIDIGYSDSFFETNEMVHEELFGINVAHEYIKRPGAHDWEFWRGSIYACLLRIGRIMKNMENVAEKDSGIKNVTSD
ncbi:MAG: hypothetical protein J1E95_10185 [Muribaculaceae bacterium]|nr:hypothetical protein [Muribaculaceae bacterium]